FHRTPLEISREMMEGQAAHDTVEGAIREGERLDWLYTEVNGDALALRLATRPRDHLRGGVNAHDVAGGSHASGGDERQDAGAGGNVEDGIAGLRAGAVGDKRPEPGNAPESEELGEQVIAGGPMNKAPLGWR